VTETAAASETARAPATAPWKRILTVCPSSWDEAQLAAARPRREGTYELLFHGQDAEDAQASFPLRALEDRRVLRVPGPAQLAEVRRRHPVSVVKVYCRPGH
jgi:hypothetical protein